MLRFFPSTALLFALVVSALPASAQSSWEAVRGLPAGTSVKVRQSNGPEQKGTVTAVTPEAISISTGRGPVSVERTRVERVQVHRANRRIRNFAIGAAIGVAVAVTVDQTLGVYLRNETSGSGRPVTYIAPIGLFGALGAAISPYKTVYKTR